MIKLDCIKLNECGYNESLLGLSYNKNQNADKMQRVAKKLSKLDKGHNKFLESIIVWLSIEAPRYWWQEFDTYRIGVTKQSQSTMHTILKNELTQNNFETQIPEDYLNVLNLILKNGNLVKLKSLLPEGFIQKRLVCTNYKSLRNIYEQRKHHKLPHWKKFIASLKENLDNPELIF